MTMRAMMDYLVCKGFNVTKKYRSEDATYVFNISKNGKGLIGEFKYPENVDEPKKNWLQEEFLDQFLKRWNRECDVADVVEVTQERWTAVNPHIQKPYGIKNVIFNEPATIVFWTDGTKTVVKCENEEYDPEKGLAMAISKKALGNQGNYYNTFSKWLAKYDEECKKAWEEYVAFVASLGLGSEDDFRDFLNSKAKTEDNDD